MDCKAWEMIWTVTTWTLACFLVRVSGKIPEALNERCPQLVKEYWTWYHDRLCYTVHEASVPWTVARDACTAMGGQLAVMDEIKLGYVLLYYHRYNSVSSGNAPDPPTLWLGGRKRSDGKFYWINGDEIRLDNWDIVREIGSFFKTFFQPKRDMCITLQRKGILTSDTWEQEPCDHSHSYICEYAIYQKTNSFIPAANTTNAEAAEITLRVTPTTTTPTPRSGLNLPTSTPVSSVMTTKISQTTTSKKGHSTSGLGASRSQLWPSNTMEQMPLEPNTMEPKTVQHVFTVFKTIDGTPNPKLIATPDAVLSTPDCSRHCSNNPRCKLYNYASNHCSLYWDEKKARKQGVKSERGWYVVVKVAL